MLFLLMGYNLLKIYYIYVIYFHFLEGKLDLRLCHLLRECLYGSRHQIIIIIIS